MKLPNGYGYFKTRQEAMKALADYNENPFDLASREITIELLEMKNSDVHLAEKYYARQVKIA